MEGKYFKWRVRLIITVLVSMVSVVMTLFYLFQEQKFAAERAATTAHNTRKMFDAIVGNLERFFIYRTHAIMVLPDVKERIKSRDTDALYQAIFPRYTILKRENPYLNIMQFHAPDGRSILRVHRKNDFGDDIASRRPMIRKTHQSRKFQSGFEGGIQGIAYRIVTPVFDGSQYIGAIEFGIDTDYIIDQLQEMLGAEAVMLLHEDRIGAADTELYHNGIGKYRFVHNDMSQARLMEEFSRNNASMRSKTVTIDEKTFEITPIFLEENDGIPVGAILCIQNITGGYQDVNTFVWESIALTAGLIVVFLILFEYAFGAMVSKIRFQEAYIRTILNSQKNIIIVSDGSNILFSNQAFLEYFHITALDDFTREYQCICDFFEQSDTEHYLRPMINGVQWTEYIVNNPTQEHKAKITFEGQTSIFEVHAQMMKFKDEVRYVVVFDDITRLNELATLDALTRVPNRFQFNKAFEYSMNLSRRSGRPFSLILFDIDHFKRINDQYGHLMGDEVLKGLTELVHRQIRKSDVLARWGGEEFVILLPDTHLEPALKLAEMLRRKIEAYSFNGIGTVTCSMGVVEYDLHETEDGMIYRVDQNLYRAKEKGRNRVCGGIENVLP